MILFFSSTKRLFVVLVRKKKQNIFTPKIFFISDMLISLLYPGEKIYEDEEKLYIFRRCATEHFIKLLSIVCARIENSSVQLLLQHEILHYFIIKLMNTNFLHMLSDIGVSAVDILSRVQERLIDEMTKNMQV